MVHKRIDAFLLYTPPSSFQPSFFPIALFSFTISGFSKRYPKYLVVSTISRTVFQDEKKSKKWTFFIFQILLFSFHRVFEQRIIFVFVSYHIPNCHHPIHPFPCSFPPPQPPPFSCNSRCSRLFRSMFIVVFFSSVFCLCFIKHICRINLFLRLSLFYLFI